MAVSPACFSRLPSSLTHRSACRLDTPGTRACSSATMCAMPRGPAASTMRASSGSDASGTDCRTNSAPDGPVRSKRVLLLLSPVLPAAEPEEDLRAALVAAAVAAATPAPAPAPAAGALASPEACCGGCGLSAATMLVCFLADDLGGVTSNALTSSGNSGGGEAAGKSSSPRRSCLTAHRFSSGTRVATLRMWSSVCRFETV
mmetsp:Transcript_21673/g.69801  ORF Transcript_21673/g.69801 Transcript_21673/m.69801 type:complete len:202 (-) Transcript_21673:178-783(-)